MDAAPLRPSACDRDERTGREVLLLRPAVVTSSRRQQFPQIDPRAGLMTTNAAGAVAPLNDSGPRCRVSGVGRDVNVASARQREGVAGAPARFVVSPAD